MINRREAIAAMAAVGCAAATAPPEPLVDTHIHFFDPKRVPYHASAPYQPPAARVEDYLEFAKAARITHTVVVHPEPYQDDHRYLDYCFTKEPSWTKFLGTCLLDPIDPKTPARMEAMKKQYGAKLIGIRIHAMNPPGEAPLTSGPIKNRDLASPGVARVFATAGAIGIAVQVQFLPHHAPAVGKLAAAHPKTRVILDHLGRFGMGASPIDAAEAVLALGRNPNTFLKFSAWRDSSKQPPPHADLAPFMMRALKSFPGRIVWGGLGQNMADHDKAKAVFATVFAQATPVQKAEVRGVTAMQKLFT